MYMWLFFENNNNDYRRLYRDGICILAIIIDNIIIVNINVNNINVGNNNFNFFINESTILYNDVR